jgi:adenylate cyclase
MADEGFKRKLTAILSADAVEYSRLMGDDEEATVRTLTSYREVLTTLIQQHNGKVLDSPGDNLLAEFVSVVDSVQCAVAVQKEIIARNDELSQSRRMQFRIGINLGDVIEEEGRIYGDGVNIAARLEGLSEPGGICISRTAYDQVKKKLSLGYEYMGEHSVKNIDEPVRVYRVLTEPEAVGKVIGEKRFIGRISRKTAMAAIIILFIVAGGVIGWNVYLQQSKKIEPASLEKMVYALPDKPSVAVLPFDNLTGDPTQEYFSDGITEEIITALSTIPELFVIARNSTFTYKGKPVKIQQVSEELGVQYVLEGSVRRAESRVRITAQLIDALTGRHLWAERYEKDLNDIFALQDEITMKIITALQVKLTEGEQARMRGKKSKNLDVYLKQIQATGLLRKHTRESLIQYGQLAQEIIDLDPENPYGYRALAWNHWLNAKHGVSPRESIAEAFKLAQKAISLDKSDSASHALLGSIYLLRRQYEKAIALGERSIALEPNGALAHALFGMTLRHAGRLDEGIGHLKQAIRLNPFSPHWYFFQLGGGYTQKGQYEDALAAFEKSLKVSPDNWSSYFGIAIVYTLLGRDEEARAAAKKLTELNPDFSAERTIKSGPWKNQAFVKLLLEAVHNLGLK